jgi:hypothetical protein
MFWRLVTESLLTQEDEEFDRSARLIYYDFDIIRFPAMALANIKHPSLDTLRELINANYIWLKGVERHCNSRQIVMVGKRRNRNNEEDERIEREFRFSSLLLSVSN